MTSVIRAILAKLASFGTGDQAGTDHGRADADVHADLRPDPHAVTNRTKEMATVPNLVAVIVINDGVTNGLSHRAETNQMALMPLVSGAAEIHPAVATRPAWEQNEED